MKFFSKGIFCFVVWIILSFRIFGQNPEPYHINGTAYQENCNCYTLTRDLYFESGSLWNIYKIDLTQSFDFNFNVFLGCTDEDGADGIVFVLQPVSTSIGSTGGGLGYEGITPSIGIAIDTWRNDINNDPFYDHIAIHKNGDINHLSSNNLAGPVTALSNSDNIEDCKWHSFRIIWDALNKKLKAQIDGVDRVETSIDLVAQVFGGDPNVFWGFTGSTGGSKNHQRVCTSLNASFRFDATQKTCFPEPIRFNDSSTSFGSILKWYWDFGDGSTDSVKAPNPHIYPQPGIYEAKLNILGNNGCVSDTFKRKIIVGSKPIAAFNFSPSLACEGAPLIFTDSSYVTFGTLNGWSWSIGSQTFTKKDPGSVTINENGAIGAKLVVSTIEGCQSETASQVLQIIPRPTVDFTYKEVCINETVPFEGINKDVGVPVQQWYWNFGDFKKDSSRTAQHRYGRGGKYAVELYALAGNGCPSLLVKKDVNIYQTNAFAGNDIIAADHQAIQLNGSGGVLYKWAPSSGLDNPDIANPIAIISHDATYILTAYTPAGCATVDTLHIKIFKGPEIYVPSAFTPNRDGKNDNFQFIAVGVPTIYFFNIYNRYGQLIYSSTNPAGWDGRFQGSMQGAGTYVWMIKGKDFNGKILFKKGTVVLVR